METDGNDRLDYDSIFSSLPSAGMLADSPIRMLADWYLTDCEAKNLQARTVEFYEFRMRYLIEALGDRNASDVSTAHLRALLMHLKETRKWSVQNTNHAVQVGKSFFNYLEKEGIIDMNPTRRLSKLRQERVFPKTLSISDVTALLRAATSDFAGDRDKTMILVLLDTGVRVGELMGLRLEDIDFGAGQLRVFGKGRKERLVPFEATVRRALLRYVGLRTAMAQSKQLMILPAYNGQVV